MLHSVSGLVNSAESVESKIVQADLIGNEVYSLYDSFSFRKIEIDNEYADLKAGEKYWLAIDSRHEYITLRTIDKVVMEVIIYNPDIETVKGIRIGDDLSQFLKKYPNAKVLTHYRTGVLRKELSFYIRSERTEINFNNDKKVIYIRLYEE